MSPLTATDFKMMFRSRTFDCGAACLATISKQYGLKIPITKIREVAGTDKRGTNAYGVIKAVEKLGFSAKGKEDFFQVVHRKRNKPK